MMSDDLYKKLPKFGKFSFGTAKVHSASPAYKSTWRNNLPKCPNFFDLYYLPLLIEKTASGLDERTVSQRFAD